MDVGERDNPSRPIFQNAIVHDWSDPDSDESVERGPIENPAYVRGAFDGHPDPCRGSR